MASTSYGATTASTPAYTSRPGTWEALGAIAYGFVVHPLAPNKPSRPKSKLPAPTTGGGLHTLREEPENETDALQYSDQATLDIGDEVYAFEKLIPETRTGAVWYRGFAVSRFQLFVLDQLTNSRLL